MPPLIYRRKPGGLFWRVSMLKVRIIPTLLYKDYTLVKGVSFNSWRRIGSVMQAVKVYNLREVDELIFLDITATLDGRRPDFDLIDGFADECFMPLTVGGGVSSLDDVRQLLKVGADKVAINSKAAESPDFIKEASQTFGSQCIVASIDVKKHPDGQYEVYSCSGTKPTGLDPVRLAREMESLGAGEILLTSIDRDGTMTGYDEELIRRVCEGISIPVIASGGAGNYEHMYRAVADAKATSVAASSMFHFTQQTPREAKQYMAERGILTRV